MSVTTARCPACDGAEVQKLADVGPLPVLCGSLWESRDEALATPVAELSLVACDRCGHVWNATFDPSLVEYDAQYDNALDFSATFNSFSDVLAKHLVDAFDLRGKRIVEIGSGKGEFLRQLCAVGGNTGLGYDPTYEGPDEDGAIRLVREFFTPGTAVDDVDFVCCRHVLEHLDDPYGFLLDVRKAVQGRPVPMYFEVPNAEFNFSESGPWDLIYPHVAYFSVTSLTALLTRAGFRVTRLEQTFHGQFLAAEVAPDTASPIGGAHGGASTGLAESFRLAATRQLEEATTWRARLDGLLADGPVALWGAGSKGVTFLSLVDHQHSIDTVIDANPRKTGLFLPGTGHEVVAPDPLTLRSVRTVLIMNPAYEQEIRSSLDLARCAARTLVV